MPQVKAYHLRPTDLIPNSPYPLLHYPALLANEADCNAAKAHDIFASNGWKTQWIFRYGPTQTSHYHSSAHECMAVLTGTATIRFGVADTSPDLSESSHGSAHEDGGVEIPAKAGDVFLIPAGVSHKTYDAKPEADFALLTPGDGHGITGKDPRKTLSDIALDGFTMLGAYPLGQQWDSCSGGEHGGRERREAVWRVPRPDRDPMLGASGEGVPGLWRESHVERLMGKAS